VAIYGVVTVIKDASSRITISLSYNPQLVQKVKTIDGRKWNKDKKYWSSPNTDGTLEKILEVLEGEEIHIDPTLRTELSASIIGMDEVQKQSFHNFEDLRRELVSRKYSYKTVMKNTLSGGNYGK
jgi:hypothetical protein